MLAVFNVCTDSSDADTMAYWKKTVSKSSGFLKNNFVIGFISK